MFGPMELANDVMIKVIGVDGNGNNAVEHAVCERTEGVEFFAVDTDAQALRKTTVGQTIQIGSGIIKGLDTDANPEASRNAASEDRETLRTALDDTDMVFITAGMGGSIDIGATPMVAGMAKDLGILTVTVVTESFNFEGKKRVVSAGQGITELPEYIDSLVTIPNDKLPKVLGRGISLLDAFDVTDDMLKGTVQSIAELITRPGPVNVDFANVHTVMSKMGYTVMGSGVTNGRDHAEEAAEMAIFSPLLEDVDLSGARGALINTTAGFNLRLNKPETVGNTIRAFASDNATAVIGTSLGPDMDDELRMTVMTIGIDMDKRPEITLVTNKQAQ